MAAVCNYMKDRVLLTIDRTGELCKGVTVFTIWQRGHYHNEQLHLP